MNYLAQTLKSAPVLITLAVLIILAEFAAPIVFTSQFGRAFVLHEPTTLGFIVAYTLVCLLLTPLVITQGLAKVSLQDLGLLLPENKKRAWLFTLGSMLVLLPATLYLADNKTIQQYYLLKNINPSHFVFMMLCALPPYYFAEEFFFRGFLFLGLWRKWKWHSYWITELLFTWAHLGKPGLEIAVAFPVGLVLNYLTLQTRSIYPAMVVHFSLGVLINILVNFVL